MAVRGRSKCPEYGGAPSRRKFGGKWYKNAGGVYDKRTTQSRARAARSKGYSARVVQAPGGGYVLYLR